MRAVAAAQPRYAYIDHAQTIYVTFIGTRTQRLYAKTRPQYRLRECAQHLDKAEFAPR